MTLLNDSEWSQWSDNAIAKKTATSQPFVSKLRHLTNIESLDDNSHLTNNIISNNLNERTYITKHGTTARMNTANIGKGSSSESSESLPPAEDNEIIPEQLSEDIEVEVTKSGFEENNHTDDNAPVEIDDAQTDTELIDSTNTKRRKGKQKLTNPLSVGDKVKVKDGHYFGGKEGVVTQITSPTYVLVAMDDDQRELIRLLDLDLPESLVKPQKPHSKEILIKEGLNYKVGEGCKWYVEVEEQIYQGLRVYQKTLGTLTLNGACSRFLVEKGILKPHPDDRTKLLENEDTTPTPKT